MKSEKNKITKQIGISLAIIGILFLDNNILLYVWLYGFYGI